MIDRRQWIAGAAAAMLTAAWPRCGHAATVVTRPATKRALRLIAAARAQIGVTLSYDPAYSRLPFPNGDVPRSTGVCTDVVIRAYRDALSLDLQALVHADMARAFASYPRNWGLKQPDRNIDHRRVPNLRHYLKRQGSARAVPAVPGEWQPGDIMTCMVGGRLPHIGIVSDRTIGGRPLVIHNIGQGTREEDMLGDHAINGCYRWQLDG